MSEDDGLKAMGQVIQIDEARIRDHLGEMVRGTVEETLNALLDAEADRLCGAGRYERTQGRQDTRAGSYERSLHTVAGEVNCTLSASTPGKRDSLPRSAQAATAALDCWFAFQFQGSRSATLLAGLEAWPARQRARLADRRLHLAGFDQGKNGGGTVATSI